MYRNLILLLTLLGGYTNSVAISMDELESQFAVNPIVAKESILDRSIELTGVVNKIGEVREGSYLLLIDVFKAESNVAPIAYVLTDKNTALSMRLGEFATVKGKIILVETDVLMGYEGEKESAIKHLIVMSTINGEEAIAALCDRIKENEPRRYNYQ